MKKLKKLQRIIERYGSCLIAYSGGVDSTFLMHACARYLPAENILVVTALSETYPSQEAAFAKKEVYSLGLKHMLIRTDELKNKRFRDNPAERCYYCKSELFGRLREIARNKKFSVVVDASTLSDRADYRPGSRAKKECGVRSPLAEAGFSKADVRAVSKQWGLATHDKPSLACLASRIPYGLRINPDDLKRINRAEEFLRRFGFKQLRLRHYGRLCRIEVETKEIPKLLNVGDLVVAKLKSLGYNYVTVDLEGYRTGSMNEVLKKARHR